MGNIFPLSPLPSPFAHSHSYGMLVDGRGLGGRRSPKQEAHGLEPLLPSGLSSIRFDLGFDFLHTGGFVDFSGGPCGNVAADVGFMLR